MIFDNLLGEMEILGGPEAYEKNETPEQDNVSIIDNRLALYDSWIDGFNKCWSAFDNYIKKHKNSLDSGLNILIEIDNYDKENTDEENINISTDKLYYIRMNLRDREKNLIEGPYLEFSEDEQNIFKYVAIQIINCFFTNFDSKNKEKLNAYDRGDEYFSFKYQKTLKFKIAWENFLYKKEPRITSDYQLLIRESFGEEENDKTFFFDTVEKISLRHKNGLNNIDDLTFTFLLKEQIITEGKENIPYELKQSIDNETIKNVKILKYTIPQV